MKSDHVTNHNRYHDERTRFDRGLLLFAHEFTHAWTAHLSYLRDGSRGPLFGKYRQCQWRTDLHIPAAFPWRQDDPGPRSLMGGRYWRDNGDGTFTPLDGYWGGGHSWLDLYATGLAEVNEVPDMFVLRNLQPPRSDLLDLHKQYRDRVVERWSHITGGRPQITTPRPLRPFRSRNRSRHSIYHSEMRL